jgi:hypothetical protein
VCTPFSGLVPPLHKVFPCRREGRVPRNAREMGHCACVLADGLAIVAKPDGKRPVPISTQIYSSRLLATVIESFPREVSPMQSHIQLGTRSILRPSARLRSASTSVCLVLLSGLFTLAAKAGAQFVPLTPAYHFAPSVNVGAAAEIGIVTVEMSSMGSLSAINIVTQGIPNQDFTFAAGGSCAVGTTYFVGQICTVGVSFQPKAPGDRQGAVVLIASDGSVMGSELTEGRGLGSLMISLPSYVQLVAGNGQWFYKGDGGPAALASLYLPMGGQPMRRITSSLPIRITRGFVGWMEPPG